jgi:dienelactone hydrolase
VSVADDGADTAAFARSAAGQGLHVQHCRPADVETVLGEIGNGRDVRLAVVGWGSAGEPAVLAAAADNRIVAIAFVGAPLSQHAIGLVEEWPEVPVLALADPADRPALKGAVDAYLASAHGGAEMHAGPLDEAMLRQVATWLDARLSPTAIVDEVELETSDGWRLHATRLLPRSAVPVPGVVLLHSGRSDRAAFARLERLLVDRGLGVLNVDWRGRGQSTSRGRYDSLGPDERAAAWRDAAAAFDHLAKCDGVDGQRLGAIGVIHGAEHAVRASQHDPRVRAIVILTGYRPGSDVEAAHLTSGSVAAFYVTSRDHRITTDAMRALYAATPPGPVRYVEYPGAAIGYQLFELDPGLEPAIAAWLEEVLSE